MSLPTDRSSSTVVLVERGGKFFVYEPSLAIVASADNVEAAYAQFLEARSGFFSAVEQAGLTLDRPPTAVGRGETLRVAGRTWLQELGLFLTKMVIVLLVIGGIGAFAAISAKKAVDQVVASATSVATSVSNSVSNTIGPALGSLGKISLADVATKAEDIARDARNLTPEDKEKLRRSLSAISRELDPMLDAWRNPPEPTPAKP